MENIVFEDRKSKILSLQKNINIINIEPKVRKPHPSIKTLFNGNRPKNRKNLKKLGNKLKSIKINSPKKIFQRPPSIQSLINDNKTEEFLSLEKSNNFNGYKIIPIKKFSSNSTLYSINNTNNIINSINNNENGKNNFTNLDLANLNSANSLPVMRDKGKKISKMSRKKSLVEIQKEKDLNQLYQEYINNVSKIIILYNYY